MTGIEAIWSGGAVVLQGHATWPEGRRLIVREETIPGIDFETENDQYDDPDHIQRWIDDLATIPALPANPPLESESTDWDETMRLFNINAVQRQFESGRP